MVGKRGWIKIVEAFIAIMLITSVLLIIINKGYIGKSDVSSKIYDAQVSILREIELDDNLRNEILAVDISAENIEVPVSVVNKVNNRVPTYLECEPKVCAMDEICALDKVVGKDIYAQSVAMTANLTDYKPRQLKLFCWVKP